MSTDRKKTHPLSVLHLIAMVALLAWWSIYFWHHSPSRALLHGHRSPRHEAGTLSGALERSAGAAFADATARASTAVRTALVDVAGGLFVLTAFAIGTGIYLRRFEIWLQARSSGDAMSLAGTGLSDKALAANATRRGQAQ